MAQEGERFLPGKVQSDADESCFSWWGSQEERDRPTSCLKSPDHLLDCSAINRCLGELRRDWSEEAQEGPILGIGPDSFAIVSPSKGKMEELAIPSG